MNGAPRNPKQIAAIEASYKDKEKLIPAKGIAPEPKLNLPKVSTGMPKLSKPRIASGITPPRFGRSKFYGEKWG